MVRQLLLPGVGCAALLLLGACDKSSSRSDDVEKAGDYAILRLNLNLGEERRGRHFRRRVSEVCRTIAEVTNRIERVGLLKRLSEDMSRLSLRQFTPQEKESMADEFWRSIEFVSYQLVQNGVDERYVSDFMLESFREYRKMCFSLGDDQDFSDGDGLEARERRRMARSLRGSWDNAISFWEQNSIRTIYYGHPDAAERFKERWHREFGKESAH